MPADHEFHPRKEAKYKDIPDDVLPVTESLACVVKVCVCVCVRVCDKVQGHSRRCSPCY